MIFLENGAVKMTLQMWLKMGLTTLSKQDIQIKNVVSKKVSFSFKSYSPYFVF